MGAEGYIWITKFKKNLADALQAAREETFASGKFFGADKHPASIEDAIGLGAESGTGSLLDIFFQTFFKKKFRGTAYERQLA